jgi:hypothetical protein
VVVVVTNWQIIMESLSRVRHSENVTDLAAAGMTTQRSKIPRTQNKVERRTNAIIYHVYFTTPALRFEL